MKNLTNFWKETAIGGIIFGIIICLISWLVPVSFILHVLMIIIGVFVIATAIPDLMVGISMKEVGGKNILITSIINILLGVALIFFQNAVLSVVAAIYLIGLPLVRILSQNDKMKELKNQLLRICLGVIILVSLPLLLGVADQVVRIIGLVVGVLVIASSIAYYFENKKAFKNLKATVIDVEVDK